MRILSTLALQGVVEALRPGFAAARGVELNVEFLPTAVLMPRLRAGERADVVLLTAEGVEALVAEGLVRGETRRDLARSFVGVAVRAGAVRPDISTAGAFVATMAGARSVAMSRQGASGIFLAGLMERLGIAEMVRGKAVVIESGFTGDLAARGEVELALQQVSELMMVAGVDVVGRLPAELGGETMFSGGVMVGTSGVEAGAALLEAIAGATALLRAKGLEGV